MNMDFITFQCEMVLFAEGCTLCNGKKQSSRKNTNAPVWSYNFLFLSSKYKCMFKWLHIAIRQTYTHIVSHSRNSLERVNCRHWMHSVGAICQQFVGKREGNKEKTPNEIFIVYKKFIERKPKSVTTLEHTSTNWFLYVQLVFLSESFSFCKRFCVFFFLLCWFLNKHFAFETNDTYRQSNCWHPHRNQNHSSFERAKNTLFMISLGFCVSLQTPKNNIINVP